MRWRGQKGFEKEQRKRGDWRSGHTAKSNWKKATNRKHRITQRKKLSAESFDDLCDRTWKRADDWWSWD